jgi:putative oxidoreductase
MNRVLSVTLPIILGGVFVCAGVLKIMDPVAFYHNIVLYHLVDDDFSWHLAHYLPWLEVIAGVGMIGRFSRPASAPILAVLLLVFMGAVGSAWARGLNIECGCFGRFSGTGSYSWVLIRDFVLLLAVVYLAAPGFFQARTRGL